MSTLVSILAPQGTDVTGWKAPLLLAQEITQHPASCEGEVDSKSEADRFSRWLGALFHGQLGSAAAIITEQLKDGEVPEAFFQAEMLRTRKLYETITALGGGSPTSFEILDDFGIKPTGDIIKRQRWTFKNGASTVGCVDYPGTDSPWHLAVLFGDDLDEVTHKLKDAAESRVSTR